VKVQKVKRFAKKKESPGTLHAETLPNTLSLMSFLDSFLLSRDGYHGLICNLYLPLKCLLFD
jgi:hypothetical protein